LASGRKAAPAAAATWNSAVSASNRLPLSHQQRNHYHRRRQITLDDTFRQRFVSKKQLPIGKNFCKILVVTRDRSS